MRCCFLLRDLCSLCVSRREFLSFIESRAASAGHSGDAAPPCSRRWSQLQGLDAPGARAAGRRGPGAGRNPGRALRPLAHLSAEEGQPLQHGRPGGRLVRHHLVSPGRAHRGPGLGHRQRGPAGGLALPRGHGALGGSPGGEPAPGPQEHPLQRPGGARVSAPGRSSGSGPLLGRGPLRSRAGHAALLARGRPPARGPRPVRARPAGGARQHRGLRAGRGPAPGSGGPLRLRLSLQELYHPIQQ